MLKTILIQTARVFFAAVFIFSGFVKAIDPLGSAYKLQDYFVAFGLEWLFPMALGSAIFLSSLEFVVGVAFLFGLKMRLMAPLGLLLMAVFTPVTIYIALTDPVPHCGCFGDAVVISNRATAFKNIIILIAAVVVFFHHARVRPLFAGKTAGRLLSAAIILILGLSAYCLINLPVIDFRPWKIGNNMAELTAPPPASSGNIFLIFENRETGRTETWPADDYPWNDAEWADLWQFRKRLEPPAEARAEEAPLAGFDIIDEEGRDITELIIADSGYLFLVVAADLQTTRRSAFDRKIGPLAEKAGQHGYLLVVLTASSPETIAAFKNQHQAGYPFYRSTERELQTIIRSNPGLLLLDHGVVRAKWPHQKIPAFEQIIDRYRP